MKWYTFLKRSFQKKYISIFCMLKETLSEVFMCFSHALFLKLKHLKIHSYKWFYNWFSKQMQAVNFMYCLSLMYQLYGRPEHSAWHQKFNFAITSSVYVWVYWLALILLANFTIFLYMLYQAAVGSLLFRNCKLWTLSGFVNLCYSLG